MPVSDVSSTFIYVEVDRMTPGETTARLIDFVDPSAPFPVLCGADNCKHSCKFVEMKASADAALQPSTGHLPPGLTEFLLQNPTQEEPEFRHYHPDIHGKPSVPLLREVANWVCYRKEGFTPLMIALYLQDAEITKQLLVEGESPHAPDRKGRNAVWWGIAGSEQSGTISEALQIVLKSMAQEENQKEKDQPGETPMEELLLKFATMGVETVAAEQTSKRTKKTETQEPWDCQPGDELKASQLAVSKSPGSIHSQPLPDIFRLLRREDIEITGYLGRGHFGIVNSGTVGGIPVAVKKVYEPETYRKWVQGEASLLELQHPNVVRMLRVIDSINDVHFVMEYVDNGDVASKINNPAYSLNWKMRVSILLDVARAMAYLHSKGENSSE